jgi:hypothetical protein
MPPYESTAAELLRTERVTSSFGYSKEWAPPGRESATSLASVEEIHRKFWLDSCVSELDTRFTPAPGPAVRAVQIAECMEARGWHLVVREASTARPPEDGRPYAE